MPLVVTLLVLQGQGMFDYINCAQNPRWEHATLLWSLSSLKGDTQWGRVGLQVGEASCSIQWQAASPSCDTQLYLHQCNQPQITLIQTVFRTLRHFISFQRFGETRLWLVEAICYTTIIYRQQPTGSVDYVHKSYEEQVMYLSVSVWNNSVFRSSLSYQNTIHHPRVKCLIIL